MMKDDDFKLLRGFADRLTEERTDICDCRVAFATENECIPLFYDSRLNFRHATKGGLEIFFLPISVGMGNTTNAQIGRDLNFLTFFLQIFMEM